MEFSQKRNEAPLSSNPVWSATDGSFEKNYMYLPLEKGLALYIWTNLNPVQPRMLCTKLGWNWFSCSGEEDENVKS